MCGEAGTVGAGAGEICGAHAVAIIDKAWSRTAAQQ
jgi:hypothetical protein